MSTDQTWKELYKIGGVSWLVAGITTIVGFILFGSMGGQPATGQAALTLTSGQELLMRTANAIFAVSDLFFIIAVFALYVALSGVRRTYALIASGLVVLSAVLDIVVNDVNFLSLGALGGQYSTATTDAQRAAFVAAADLALAATNVGLPLVFLVMSVGILIFGLVMLKGLFGKGTAYLGILTGVVGIIGSISISVFPIVFVVGLILAGIWCFPVGYRLLRLV
jgi:hypothetical protein